MIGPVKRGRPAPITALRPPLTIPADVILIAVGQDIVSAPFEAFGMAASRGRFAADEHLLAPGFSNVFVGGDCQTGPATIIRAIGAGKVAARNIDHALGYSHTLPCDIVVPTPARNNRTATGRVNVPERLVRDRKHDFLEVELENTQQEILQECSRCLRCDYFGCGTQKGGRIRYE